LSCQHWLEQRDKAQRAEIEKFSIPARPQVAPRTLPAGTMLTTFNEDGAANEVISADELLRRRAAALREKDPGLTAAQATLRASQDPEFVKALNAERERKMIAASRLYG
jgi:hypothetical protein